ncbi:hypothetical protein [Christiangramia sabulilitoris]|uniref:Uncharacterized protein n=1 Tax=Christiangramia sabulilitoris TaxID=2583991 RepID=A0A550I7J5_9FLAO|nr:hypothetical protein [Christiangramia sabulilitoris]TRO66944.1 hypothetical protein FGM01_03375 [Christiangramia sabulilitoris]
MKELGFNEMENLYCPVTGHQVLDPEQFNPSPALVFNYIKFEGGSFPYLREDFKEKFSEYYMNENHHSTLYKILTEKELNNSGRYLWITLEGHPFDTSFCFDMTFGNEQSKDNPASFLKLRKFQVK